jgi:hypothetical protein
MMVFAISHIPEKVIISFLKKIAFTCLYKSGLVFVSLRRFHYFCGYNLIYVPIF